MRSRHLSVVIRSTPDEVYAFARTPSNLPRWAAGLATGEVRQVGDALVVESPMGRVTVDFVAPNGLRVLDHDVTLPGGEVVTNPVRVLAHPDGAEVVFTLRQLGLTDEAFARDAALVEADLARLRALLEPDPD